MKYDIALLRLETPLIFNEKVGPVKLPEENDELVNVGIISGWGELGVKGKTSPVLQIQRVPIFAHDKCVDAMNLYVSNFVEPQTFSVQEDIICTGPVYAGVSICSVSLPALPTTSIQL